MSFMVFQLLFAVVAVALVVVAVLIVRQLAAKRQSSESLPSEFAASEIPSPPLAEPQAPKLRIPGLGRKAPEREPEADEPLPPRRRQLHSFAEAERNAAEADAVVLPVLEPEAEAEPEVEPEQMAQTDLAPQFEAEPEEAPAAELEAEHMTDEALDYSEAVLGRLEEAFEELQGGEITLATYRERMQAEQAAVEARVAALQPGGESAELDAALAARDSVLWCLDWAEEQASAD